MPIMEVPTDFADAVSGAQRRNSKGVIIPPILDV
jgi:hypothetical protein